MKTRRLFGSVSRFGSVGSVSAAALLAAALARPVAGQVTERVSVDSLEAQANNASDSPSISAYGRHVAFESFASNLVTGDTNGFVDIFVRDRQGDTTERVSVDSAGAQGNGDSFEASISADGRYVAFESSATNLVSGDTNGRVDVFVRDRQTGTTERVSVDSAGAQGNGDSLARALSADGRYVAFRSVATNLVSGDTNGVQDVFLRDRQAGTTERVSIDSAGVQGNGDSSSPSISSDGRYVVFRSAATNLVSGDTSGWRDIFLRDRQSGTTERVSVDSLGAQGNGSSQYPSISADGRYVAFHSYATNLVSGDTNGAFDVLVRDRQSGTTERVSVDTAGAQGNEDSDSALISSDGRYVAFKSAATNLVSGDTNAAEDIFVRDTCDTTATSASFSGDGINADTVAPQDAVIGSSWSAPLTIGHPHGAGGAVALAVRTSTFNGPNLSSPIGGRVTEILISGPLLARITGAHNGVTGGIAPQLIPEDSPVVFAGLAWAAQYTVTGGGFADLSQAVFGIVGCQ